MFNHNGEHVTVFMDDNVLCRSLSVKKKYLSVADLNIRDKEPREDPLPPPLPPRKLVNCYRENEIAGLSENRIEHFRLSYASLKYEKGGG